MRPETPLPSRPEARFRLRQLLAGFVGVALLGACDVPTDPPQVESRWIVPAEETSFGVADLLPGDVTLTADSSAFLVDFDPISFSQTLSGLCPACAAADGLTVPKPAFAGGFASNLSFPPEVSAIELLDGQVEVELVNGFNFDPIRPASGVYGSITLTITDEADGDVIGSTTIDGQGTAFGPGSTLTRDIDVLPVSVEGAIRARVDLVSPTGDPVTVDASLSIPVTVTPRDITVGRVTIDVANEVVSLDPRSLDLEDVDEELVDHVVSGDFVLDVVNPFGVAADFQITISGPTITTIQKSAAISSQAESTVVIEFTVSEIRSFLGEPGVVLAGGATVDPAAAPVSVLPGERLILTAALDLTLLIGG